VPGDQDVRVRPPAGRPRRQLRARLAAAGARRPWTDAARCASNLRPGSSSSCNAYFAQLAAALGPQPVLDAASLFGIEVARPADRRAAAATIAHAGYGQGEVVVSPLKMARVAAAVANEGWCAGPVDR
jgi:membrane peptidoglycan carboxypeptidase